MYHNWKYSFRIGTSPLSISTHRTSDVQCHQCCRARGEKLERMTVLSSLAYKQDGYSESLVFLACSKTSKDAATFLCRMTRWQRGPSPKSTASCSTVVSACLILFCSLLIWSPLARLPSMFLFATKISPLLLLLGPGNGYEKLNYIHCWSGHSMFCASKNEHSAGEKRRLHLK